MNKPKFKISLRLASILIEIDKMKNEIAVLPITASVLQGLRESSMVQSSHYSTFIEGNRLTQQEVASLLQNGQRYPKKERDEKEVLGYYAALEAVRNLVDSDATLSEEAVRQLHGMLMAGGRRSMQPSPYRDGQNVIRDSRTGDIVYLPPEAVDVLPLMSDLIVWLKEAKANGFPAPISGAIAHYQFATIHPYYDGNGRTARLFAHWILHRNGYGLKGIYSLEEYYAQDLQAYYDALSIGPSHNYYFGREDADITLWVEYFCAGMLESFERVKAQAEKAMQKGARDTSLLIRRLTKPQQIILEFFKYHDVLRVYDVELLLKLSDKTARNWVKRWVDDRFLVVDNPSKKKRSYRLAQSFRDIFG